MDTDELTKMAWYIIVRAAWISDTLKVELAALSNRYKSEDEWLRGVSGHLEEIVIDPEEYVDYWNLEEEEGITPVEIKKFSRNLRRRIEKVLRTPLGERGPKRW